MGFQKSCSPNYDSVDEKREHKRRLVQLGEAQAAVVFDHDLAVGWCQFGQSRDLSPSRKFRRRYLAELVTVPDWHITCFFVDRDFRGQGVASHALDGALSLIAQSGGGLVEAYPEAVEGRSVKGTFIPLGTVTMFERRGFARQRQVALHHWVMTKTVEPIV